MELLLFLNTIFLTVSIFFLGSALSILSVILSFILLFVFPLFICLFAYMWVGVNIPLLGLAWAWSFLSGSVSADVSDFLIDIVDRLGRKLNLPFLVWLATNVRKAMSGRFGLFRRVVIFIIFFTYISFRVSRQAMSSRIMTVTFCLMALVNLLGVTTLDLAYLITFIDIEVLSLPHKYFSSLSAAYSSWRDGRHFRRTAMAVLLITILNALYSVQLIGIRYDVGERSRKRKIAKVLRSFSVLFARFIDGVRVPQIFRSAGEAGFTNAESDLISSNLNAHFDYLRMIGYPVSEEVVADDPVLGLLDGKFDTDWLIAGSNWRIHAPVLQAYAQPEFRKFQNLVEEYKPTFSYMTLDNQLSSISRYFYNPSVNFPDGPDVLDAVWPIVKQIYGNSRITPFSAIYKAWNKRFNVGVFATSSKKTKYGGFKKLSRREWIGSVGGPFKAIKAFEKMAKFGVVFDTYAQFFTKKEWLKPKKWLNSVVRTPVAAFLPEYLVQMSFSMEPNKRFEYKTTPIKLGMPINAASFDRIWTAHSRFQKHFAGDCTAFDSTIVGPVIKLIKAVRLKGFDAHKDYKQIETLIDVTYDRIETAKLVSAQTGNVYNKGSGLMTGHGSTSPDNSLTVVGLYLVGWKVITGRSASEFRHYNELTVYGDDHALSISDLAPPAWCWDNIAALFKTWGVEMREEVPSGGKGLPLEMVPFLKKACRKPTVDDQVHLAEAFGDDAPNNMYVTYHDRESLMGKAISAQTNKDIRYRAKRIQSYMYLCHHNKDIYDIFHDGLEKMFKSNPKVRQEIGKYTPSYSKVLRVFYTDKLPKNVVELSDDSIVSEFEDDALILYGEITPIEKFLNFLSVIPDYPNPAVRNAGPIEKIMVLGGSLLSWPKELLSRVNSAKTVGHVEQLVGNSSYDWLSKSVPRNSTANDITLLTRHWIYMMLCEKKVYSLHFHINGFFMKIISLNFIINGFIASSRPKWGLSYYNLILVALLSFLNIPDVPEASRVVMSVKIPDIAGWTVDVLDSAWALIVHQIPTSFNDVLPAMIQNRKIVVTAPTGSGKSTAMIEFIASTTSSDVTIYVIVPRVNLAHSLSAYMNTQFMRLYGSISGDRSENRSAHVIYVTTGVFLSMFYSIKNKGNIFILDEYHVREIDTIVAADVLIESDERVLFVSATPIELSRTVPEIQLVVNNTYSIFDKMVDAIGGQDIVRSYISTVLTIARAHNQWQVHLIFVDSFDEMNSFVDSLPGKVSTISSRGVNLFKDSTFIVATSSADVGVTIPNVDIVVTKSIQRRDGPRGVGFYPLDQTTRTQRRGRTGRTNNGTAYIVNFPNAKVHPEGGHVSVRHLLLRKLSNGLDYRNELGLLNDMRLNPIFNDLYALAIDAMRDLPDTIGPDSKDDVTFAFVFSISWVYEQMLIWEEDRASSSYINNNDPREDDMRNYLNWALVIKPTENRLENYKEEVLTLIECVRKDSTLPFESKGYKHFVMPEGALDFLASKWAYFPWLDFMYTGGFSTFLNKKIFVKVPGHFEDRFLTTLSTRWAFITTRSKYV